MSHCTADVLDVCYIQTLQYNACVCAALSSFLWLILYHSMSMNYSHLCCPAAASCITVHVWNKTIISYIMNGIRLPKWDLTISSKIILKVYYISSGSRLAFPIPISPRNVHYPSFIRVVLMMLNSLHTLFLLLKKLVQDADVSTTSHNINMTLILKPWSTSWPLSESML